MQFKVLNAVVIALYSAGFGKQLFYAVQSEAWVKIMAQNTSDPQMRLNYFKTTALLSEQDCSWLFALLPYHTISEGTTNTDATVKKILPREGPYIEVQVDMEIW